MADVKRAAVIGASGYTGVEAVRLIAGHPRLNLVALTGNRQAGQGAGDVFASLSGTNLPDLQGWEAVDWDRVDVAFACLPHGASQEVVSQIMPSVDTVVDLSADFRLRDASLYAQTYDRPHDFPDLLSQAVYGLSEWARQDLAGASLIACPGCFPTCVLLGVLPGIAENQIEIVTINALTGVSGAGRKATQDFAYSEVADGARAYGVGAHRHAPEIDQMISRIGGRPSRVSFTPHLVPMIRGMVATTVVKLNGASAEALHAVTASRYADMPFVDVLPFARPPRSQDVRASNLCRIGVFADRVPGQAIIVSAIDNLTKGSAGQAVQNYNLSQSWDETLGLRGLPVFP